MRVHKREINWNTKTACCTNELNKNKLSEIKNKKNTQRASIRDSWLWLQKRFFTFAILGTINWIKSRINSIKSVKKEFSEMRVTYPQWMNFDGSGGGSSGGNGGGGRQGNGVMNGGVRQGKGNGKGKGNWNIHYQHYNYNNGYPSYHNHNQSK